MKNEIQKIDICKNFKLNTYTEVIYHRVGNGFSAYERLHYVGSVLNIGYIEIIYGMDDRVRYFDHGSGYGLFDFKRMYNANNN